MTESTGRKSDAKEALLGVAEQLFVEKGYEAVSTRDLAEAAQVNLGAIQYHFGSKAKLFVETVKSLCERSGWKEGIESLQVVCTSREQAGKQLCLFIYGMLDCTLRPKGPQVCKLMFREILNESESALEIKTALVHSVVEEFYAPMVKALVGALQFIAPQKSLDQLHLIVFSILGQGTFYVTDKPFIDALGVMPADVHVSFDSMVKHIITFSLSAIGCEQEFINQSIHEAFQEIQQQEQI